MHQAVTLPLNVHDSAKQCSAVSSTPGDRLLQPIPDRLNTAAALLPPLPLVDASAAACCCAAAEALAPLLLVGRLDAGSCREAAARFAAGPDSRCTRECRSVAPTAAPAALRLPAAQVTTAQQQERCHLSVC